MNNQEQTHAVEKTKIENPKEKSKFQLALRLVDQILVYEKVKDKTFKESYPKYTGSISFTLQHLEIVKKLLHEFRKEMIADLTRLGEEIELVQRPIDEAGNLIKEIQEQE